MKKRISDLLNGKFEYRPESFEISAEKIEGTVPKGENFRGKFSVKAMEGKSIRGFLYSTNVRAGFSPAMFYASRETFSFEIDTKGMEAGTMVEGAFVICTTSGEHELPYRIAIQEEKGTPERLRKYSPEEFAALAKEDFGKAYVLFVSREFSEILADWDPSFTALYEGIRGQSVSYHSLEQFLVGGGLKEPLKLTPQMKHLYFHDVEETTREEVLLTKNTWGFMEVRISSDNDFLTVERPSVTTEEFVGSIYNVSFVLHPEKLHGGRNFARLTIRMGCQTEECVVEVRRTGQGSLQKPLHRQKQEITALMSAYIDYRAERMGVQEWTGISLGSLENYRKAGGNHIFADLYESYLLYCKEETLKAELCMQQVTERREELALPQWQGFYLYLTTFQNQEKEYGEYVQDEIRKLFLENQENWILQWLMFRVNGHLIKNDTEKLDSIRRQYLCGCKSPVMYLEATDILKTEPLLLRNLEEFEIHLLRFICREHLLDREICGQAAQLACRFQKFHPVLFPILCRSYEVYPTKNMLTAICSMLIKGHRKGKEYAKWFELGVRQDVRITGLYEYYVQTMEEPGDKLLPQSVRMYFIYHNTLDYVKKAAIYANIIRNRTRDPKTYEDYRKSCELFMEEQLLAGRINRDLALIYQVMLTRMVMDKAMAEGLSKVIFTWEIICENPKMKHVIVVHEQFRQEQRVMLSGGRACVKIYSPYCSILLEDGDGRRYGGEELYKKERLLNRPVFEEYLREFLEASTGLIISDCCSQTREIVITSENVKQFVILLGMEEIKESYKKKLEKKLTEFYGSHPDAEYLYEFLELADDSRLAARYKRELAELLVREGMCGRAYELVCRYGTEQVSARTLVRICSYQTEKQEYGEDGLLTAVCAQCFFRGVYEEGMLKYLLQYYEGPIESMKKLWRAGKGFELEAFGLEERILTLILFERQGLADTEEIFEAYWHSQGKSKICRAYVTLMCYRYFVKEEPAADCVFTYIEEMMLGNVSTADVCRLALLMRYTRKSRLSEGQKKWMRYLLEKYDSQGMRFAFYRDLPDKLKREFHLQDRFILEYRTDPAEDVILHYQINDGKEESVLMRNTFEGIFTKEFVLFYLDRLTWYFTVECDGKKRDTEKKTYSYTRRSVRGSTARYDLINRMIEADHRQDEALYRKLKEQYIGQQYLVEELF